MDRAGARAAAVARHVCGGAPAPAVAVSGEVAAALARGAPVVALESTIISHGMPYPENVRTARAVEAIVRAEGCVPATVAIMRGVPTVGISDAQLEELAKLGHGAKKTSRRDVPRVVASGDTGATTVSATMLLAERAGVRVFVTGGIGGVHRGAERTFDVSADLTELGRTRVAVVCAGAKSILDVPKTLEYLETQGVPVVAYGTDEFPAFFTRSSGVRAPARADTPEECADMLVAMERMGMESGALFAVPVPRDAEADAAPVEAATAAAVAEAERRRVSGADTTPFILKYVADTTRGASLAANVALVRNNALVGSRIARAYAAARKRRRAAAEQ